MVSRREIKDYIPKYVTIPGAVYLVYPIVKPEESAKKSKKKQKIVQEEVIYDTKKLCWVAKFGDDYITIDELAKLGYNISHMAFPIPEDFSSIPDKQRSISKYERIVTDKSAFLNLRFGRWYDMKHNSHTKLIENKLYEFLSSSIKSQVSPSLHNENRIKLANGIVRLMAKLSNKRDLEKTINSLEE